MKSVSWFALAVVLVVAAGWWTLGGNTRIGPGELSLEWRGDSEGNAVLPGSISWCPVNRTATLEAISADTGLLVSLLETDSLTTGVHPVVSPDLRAQAPRPGAVAALRWVQDTTAIVGFRSVSGLISMEEVGNTASGRIDIRMRHAVSSDTVLVRGTFRELPVTTSAVGCP